MNLLEKIDKYLVQMNKQYQDVQFSYYSNAIIKRNAITKSTILYKECGSKEDLESWLDDQLKEDEELSYECDWLLGLPLIRKEDNEKIIIDGLKNWHSKDVLSYKTLNKTYTLLNGKPITYKNFLKWKFEQNKKYEEDYEKLGGLECGS